MLMRLIVTIFAFSLVAVEWANPVGSNERRDIDARVSHYESATSGGKVMGGGS